MRFSLLLWILYQKLRKASKKNSAFRKYIGTMRARVLIKTTDGKLRKMNATERAAVDAEEAEKTDKVKRRRRQEKALAKAQRRLLRDRALADGLIDQTDFDEIATREEDQG